MNKYAITMKLHSYPKNEVKEIRLDKTFDSREEAIYELLDVTEEDLQAYRDSNPSAKAGFKLDFDSDFDAIIRFWDGYDYKIVVEYEIEEISTI